MLLEYLQICASLVNRSVTSTTWLAPRSTPYAVHCADVHATRIHRVSTLPVCKIRTGGALPTSELGKFGKHKKLSKNIFVCPILQLRGFWQDRSVRKKGAQLYGPRVSNCLSHRIVKSLTLRIYGKLRFQCTRNGPRKPPFCPGSIQNAFTIFPRYLTTRFFNFVLPEQKIENMKIPKPRFTNKCPAWMLSFATLE